jgi:hypothetical protein
MLRRWISVSLLLASSLLMGGGCAWFEQLRGPGFPGWEENGNSLRGKNTDAKPSGFLYDNRSRQIEKNLGGNF